MIKELGQIYLERADELHARGITSSYSRGIAPGPETGANFELSTPKAFGVLVAWDDGQCEFHFGARETGEFIYQEVCPIPDRAELEAAVTRFIALFDAEGYASSW